MIGNPPNIAVPTHFAKVILTSRPQTTSFGLPAKSASNALTVSDAVRDVSVGAFVLPNAVIPDQVPLTSFQVPGELFPPSSPPPLPRPLELTPVGNSGNRRKGSGINVVLPRGKSVSETAV